MASRPLSVRIAAIVLIGTFFSSVQPAAVQHEGARPLYERHERGAFAVDLQATRAGNDRPRFAAATIRQSTSGETKGSRRLLPGGRWIATGVTLRELAATAYQRHGFDRRDVSGGPAWVDSDRFDVDARAPAEHVIDGDGFPRQTMLMLQSLLEERFNLEVRQEPSERPVYELAMVSPDGAPGPRLRRSDTNCAEVMAKQLKGQRSPTAVCAVAQYPGRLVGTAMTMPALASILSGVLDRPVLDRTGVDGNFDFDVEAVEFRPPGPFGPSYRPSDTTESIVAALPRQLGLRMAARSGIVEVIVIEAAERPQVDERR